MQNFFLILGLISAILVAVSAFGYNYYSNLKSDKTEKNAQKERVDIHDKVTEGNENLSNKLNNQDSLLTYIKKGQTDIKNEVKSSVKKSKQGINVQNSPNAIIQVNENGDNVIDKSTNIYTSKQRKVTKPMGEQILKMLDERLAKYDLGQNGKIVVTCPSDAESNNFGMDIVNFLIANNYNVYNGLNTYIGSDKGFENLDVAFKFDKNNERLELWINTLKQ